MNSLPRSAAASASKPYRWPWWSWLATLVSYVALGYQFKTLVLNWIVGPLYPVLVMYALPKAVLLVLRRRPPAGHATPASGAAP